MLKTFNSVHYGDQWRWFIGIVVSNKDPLKLGRVKIRARGVHTANVNDISTNDLPWAQVIVPSTEGGISGVGKMPRIQNGAQVFGFFADGKSSQVPIVMGSMHHIENKKRKGSTGSTNNNRPLDSNDNDNNDDAVAKYGQNIARTKPGDLPGGSNGEKIFNYLKGKGLTSEQAAGVIGNLAAESNLNPEAYNPNDVGKPAYGLAQWRAERYDKLRTYENYETLETQMDYMWDELTSHSYLGLGALRNSKTVGEATSVFETKFERPRPGTFNKRFNYASDAYDNYS